MSGAMRKIGEYLGLLEDTGHYDDYDGDTETSTHDAVDQRPVVRDRRPAPVSDLAERRRPASVQTGVVAELSRITTLHPRNYNEARLVGENYRDGTPVIMNLSEMDDNDAKRLVDFAAGLIFATRGSIERVTNKVFLLSPPNVAISAMSLADRGERCDAGGMLPDQRTEFDTVGGLKATDRIIKRRREQLLAVAREEQAGDAARVAQLAPKRGAVRGPVGVDPSAPFRPSRTTSKSPVLVKQILHS